MHRLFCTYMRILLTSATERQMQVLELTKVVLVMRESDRRLVEEMLTFELGIETRAVLHKETVRVSLDCFLDQVAIGFGLDLEISWRHNEIVVGHVQVSWLWPNVFMLFR